MLSGRLFAHLAALANEHESPSLFAQLVISRNEAVGMVERLHGFSEMPLISMGGDEERHQAKKNRRPAPSSMSFG